MATNFFKVRNGIGLSPLNTPPSDPVKGDTYYNSASNTLTFYNGTSWVTFGVGNQSGSELTFTGANNVSTPANVTGLSYDGSAVKTVKLFYSVYRFHTGNFEGTRLGSLSLTYKPDADTWEILDTFSGDNSGVTFSITSLGQVQYISDNKAGSQTEFEMKFFGCQAVPNPGPEMSVLKVRNGIVVWEVDWADMTKIRSNKDTGIYKTIEWKDSTDTLRKRSVLSGGIAPNFTTRTVNFYDTDGTTVLDTIVYALTYDIDGDLEKEEIV